MLQGKKIVFMFSGQGSQFIEMGESLYKTNARFKYHMDCLDDIYFCNTNSSFVNELYNRKNSDLLYNDVGFGCVALFAIQYSLARVLIENKIEPDELIGTSLGEYVALAVSGVANPGDMMMYVYNVTSLIQSMIPESGMLTVVADVRNHYIEDVNTYGNGCVGANNYNGHFVVSALKTQLEYLKQYYDDKDILTFLLPTKVGFHNTELIEPFKERCMPYLENLITSKPTIDVISCMTVKKVEQLTGDYLFNIMAKPIMFSEVCKKIDTSSPTALVDLGPMGTLAGFAKKTLINDLVSTYSLMNLAGDKLDTFLSLYR